jgi:hypothetical protein
MAPASVTATRTTGDFIAARSALPSIAPCRERLRFAFRKRLSKKGFQGRIGIAMLTLIEITMTAHSESTPSASEAATASISRDETTGALRLLKPGAPDDRVIVEVP